MPKLTAAAAVLTVSDVAASTRHYRDVLGFTVMFEYGEPTRYVCLCRDDVQVHLASTGTTRHAPGNGDLAIFVTEVDAVYADLSTRGANVLGSPQNYDYGMRDFSILDPDGNRITFGEGIKPD